MSRLDELLEQHFDAALSEDAARELELLLAQDAQARNQFWKSAEWHAQLRIVAARRAESNRTDSRQFAPGDDDAEMARQHGTRSPFVPTFFRRVVPAATWLTRHNRPISWIAAAIVMVIAVGAMTVIYSPKPRDRVVQSNSGEWPSTEQSEARFIARLTRLHEAEWESPREADMPGDSVHFRRPETLQPWSELAPGDRLYLKRGVAEIEFGKGTRIVLEGPARLTIDGDNFCALDRGKLVARVEINEARGFAVRTPTATITDLGTEFGVEVKESGAVSAQVFRGEIEIVQTAVSSGGRGSGPPARVGAGQSAAVRGGKVAVQPAGNNTFANTRLPELRGADCSIIVYQEDFHGFTVGPISGQRGWTATSGHPQIVIGGLRGADRVVAGTNSSTPGAARNLTLYSIPSATTELIFQGRMRMRSQFGNRAGFVDRTGKVILGFGAGYGGYNFVVVDDSENKLFSGNAPGGSALSPTSHAWYDVRFTVDFNGDGKATGTFAVKKDDQPSFSTLATGLNLKLNPRFENPAQWTGLLLAMRSSSDIQGDLQLSYVPLPPAADSKAATGISTPRGSNRR